MLEPTKEMLDGYKKWGASFDDNDRKSLDLMAERQTEELLNSDLPKDACLLCSGEKVSVMR